MIWFVAPGGGTVEGFMRGGGGRVWIGRGAGKLACKGIPSALIEYAVSFTGSMDG
jgi:hypothetical protein